MTYDRGCCGEVSRKGVTITKENRQELELRIRRGNDVGGEAW